MVKTKRMMKKTWKKKKGSVIYFFIFTFLYIIFLMWLYGTVKYYIPTIYIGAGQYFDLSVGVVLIGIGTYMFIATFLFKFIRNKIN